MPSPRLPLADPAAVTPPGVRGPIRALRNRPATATIAALMLALGVAQLLLRPRAHDWGTTTAALGDWSRGWHLLLAPFTAAPLGGWIVALLVATVSLAVAEPRLGSLRTFVTWMAGGSIGAAAGLASVLLGVAMQDDGALAVRSTPLTDVTPAILAVLVAASTRDRSGRLAWIPVPAVTLTVALLLYSGDPRDIGRLVGAAVGLAAGLLSGGRLPRPELRRGRYAARRRALALATFAVAVGPLAVFFGPRHPGVLSLLGGAFVAQPTWTPATLASGLGLLNVAVVILMLVVARGLLLGTRAGAVLAIVLYLLIGAVGIGGYVLPAIVERWFSWGSLSDVELDGALLAVAAIPLALAIVTAAQLRCFSIPMRPGTATSALRALLLAGLVCGGAYVLIALGAGADPSAVAVGAPSRFLPPGVLNVLDIDPSTIDPVVRVVGRWCGLAFWIVVIVVVHRAVLSIAPGREQRAVPGTVRAQLELYGGGALGHMATWPGWRIWLDDERATVIAYRLVGRVALALGQPIGPGADEARAVAQFSRWCDDRGWSPAFYSAPHRLRPLFDELGWRTVSIGSEAIVELRGFSLTGKRKQNIRTAVNRAEREGIAALWLSASELTAQLSAEVRRVSEAWTSARPLPEMGFTLGGVEQLNDPEVRVMLAVDGGGRVHAVTSWLPVYEHGDLVGYTLDVMRRDTDAMPGVIEFLIARTAFRCRDAGLDRLSLSVAPLASTAAGRRGDRWMGRLGRLLEPLYGFRSLAAFKARFEPVYQPVLLAFPGDAALAPTAAAVLRSYLPGLSVGAVLRGAGALLRRPARA